MVKGREFDARDRDRRAARRNCKQFLARRYFPGENPVGRKLIVATPGKPAIEVTREIVGVAGDVRYLTGTGAESLEIYLPFVQTTWPNIYVMLRTTATVQTTSRRSCVPLFAIPVGTASPLPTSAAWSRESRP